MIDLNAAAGGVIKAHGFTPDTIDQEEGWIGTAETTFSFYANGEVGVTMWAGAWPFALDYDMGILPSLADAIRYADWLIKRENFQIERAESF